MSLVKPQPETTASSWMCIVNCPQHAVAVLLSCLPLIQPSSFCLHCFLLLLSSLPLACVPQKQGLLLSLRTRSKSHHSPPQAAGLSSCCALSTHSLTPVRDDSLDNMLLIWSPQCFMVSIPILPETKKRNLSINNLKCVRSALWDNGEQWY